MAVSAVSGARLAPARRRDDANRQKRKRVDDPANDSDITCNSTFDDSIDLSTATASEPTPAVGARLSIINETVETAYSGQHERRVATPPKNKGGFKPDLFSTPVVLNQRMLKKEWFIAIHVGRLLW